MATAADGELILKLYEMRREAEMRKARRFMIFDFQPKTLEELRAVSRDLDSPHNPAWRQVTSYWEMAHALVLRGALDADLFLDTNGEGILIYAKFHHFHVETEKQSGNPFMRNTAALIAKYPTAQKLHDGFLKSLGLA
ncbi:DUF4760 domain-containing protein [Edaphobacter flagellatus]|uniref:DUF4760 domain-containing protein n=1 Tax=Edaphobacter flagellatus TaxID=1933044 RepID=UPI0021B3C472|nr:hypothetical protein [Edaphobacter flagellatus]